MYMYFNDGMTTVFHEYEKPDKMTKGTVVSDKEFLHFVCTICQIGKVSPTHITQVFSNHHFFLFLKESNKSLPKAHSSEILLKIIQ